MVCVFWGGWFLFGSDVLPWYVATFKLLCTCYALNVRTVGAE